MKTASTRHRLRIPFT